jgi:hypothetical protein
MISWKLGPLGLICIACGGTSVTRLESGADASVTWHSSYWYKNDGACLEFSPTANRHRRDAERSKDGQEKDAEGSISEENVAREQAEVVADLVNSVLYRLCEARRNKDLTEGDYRNGLGLMLGHVATLVDIANHVSTAPPKEASNKASNKASNEECSANVAVARQAGTSLNGAITQLSAANPPNGKCDKACASNFSRAVTVVEVNGAALAKLQAAADAACLQR